MRLAAILILLNLSAFAQNNIKQKLFKDFPHSYCDCLHQRDSAMSAYLFMEECLWRFVSAHGDEIVLFSEQNKDSISEIEKGKKLGLEITFSATPSLIKDCNVYRAFLNEYKDVSMKKMKVSRESAKGAIVNLKSKRQGLNDQSKLGLYFIFLGMMLELDGDPIAAGKSYEESIYAYPTMMAKALQTLLLLPDK